ncbi:MAG: winged helix-turn-helix domain-containing protein [Candidatus Micrarchaeota archaeon]
MDMKLNKRKEMGKRSIGILLLMLVAIGALYYQNVISFDAFYTLQGGQIQPLDGPPLLSASSNSQAQKDAIAQDAAIGADQKRIAAPLAAPAALAIESQAQTITTETYREKGALQDPGLYYAAIGIVGLLLFMSIFKVSFQSAAVFDSDIFKTLSSETRVEMLYALQERRKTLSELALQAGISLPGAKQHLALLETKGLVRKMDEGRKWKYYELTDQGKSIIAERFS